MDLGLAGTVVLITGAGQVGQVWSVNGGYSML